MANPLWRGKLLGVVGGGNMAEALVRGVLAAGLIPAAAITVYDPLTERLEIFNSLGCQVAVFPAEAANVDVILLATKPQVLPEALAAVAVGVRPETIVVSIAAGIPVATIEAALPAGSRVVRVMPNTPLLVGRGASALARGGRVSDDDMRMALDIFSSAGLAREVPESELDAVTALSGSGPAYLFRFAEALMAAGEEMGLAPELSRELTIATLYGSAVMLDRFRDPAPLRERVTSPGGTTAAALRVLDEGGFAELVASALAAARRRSEELGSGK